MVYGIDLRKVTLLSVLAIAFLFSIIEVPSAWGGPMNNYGNFTVRTTVNVTDSYPEILTINCSNTTGIVLTAGDTKKVLCIVVIQDFNGGDTLNETNNASVNATFYFVSNQSTDADQNSTHYTNSSCTASSTAYGPSNYRINWTCAFDVWYYANNGSWYVNATVFDPHNGYNLTTTHYNTTSINALYALNVTEEINFGDMAVGDTTGPNPVQANITNLGNVPINFTVYGFGGDNITTGTGLAMLCDVRNITANNQRYSIISDAAFGEMTTITASSALIPNITVPKQNLPDVLMQNSTYWRLHVNVSNNPFGVCNGSVVFSAIRAS